MPRSKAFPSEERQRLPRHCQEVQISTLHPFSGFAPADNPKVLGLVIINDPKGVYYGGTIAAPVMKEIFENVLPYLEIEQKRVKCRGTILCGISCTKVKNNVY